MNRRQFLAVAAAVPFSQDARAMPVKTRYPSCSCGHFEAGPSEGSLVQCETCRGWVNRAPSPAEIAQFLRRA